MAEIDKLTNGAAIREGIVPCETNRRTGGLSRTDDAFHGAAEVTVGSRADMIRHVCRDCAHDHHRHLKLRAGILWASVPLRHRTPSGACA